MKHLQTVLSMAAFAVAVPLSIFLAAVLIGPILWACQAFLIGFGLYSIGYRLTTGRWPKGRAKPTPEPRDQRLAIHYKVIANGWDKCDLPGGR